LPPPSSPIASDGEESSEIESFEERIARFEDETLVQQWYGEASFSGFGFNYGGMASASSSHPPPFDSLLRHKLMMMMKRNAMKKTMMRSEASRRPPPPTPTSSWCLMTKGEKY
jgi:hypothetical protein